jgi:hypothetical protein
MQHHPEPDLEELLWTVAAARVMFGPHMNIQAPPNLTPSIPAAAAAATVPSPIAAIMPPSPAPAPAAAAAVVVEVQSTAAPAVAAGARWSQSNRNEPSETQQQQQQEGVENSWVQLLNAGINDWGEKRADSTPCDKRKSFSTCQFLRVLLLLAFSVCWIF